MSLRPEARAALREAFAVVDREVRRWDAEHGGTELADMVDAWGEELEVFHGPRTGRRSGGPPGS